MLSLIFSRDKTGNFLITDYNDEQLYVIAQILVHETAKTYVKNLLDIISEVRPGVFHTIKATDSVHLAIDKLSNTTVRIKLTDTEDLNENTKKFIVEVPVEQLTSLIDQWNDKAIQQKQIITITREQDTYQLHTGL